MYNSCQYPYFGMDANLVGFGLNTNWYGLKNAASTFFSVEQLEPINGTVDAFNIHSVINSEFDTDQTMFNTSFFMKEEFVAVYKLLFY